MDGFSVLSWLPGILFLLVIFGRFIWPLIVRAVIKTAEKKEIFATYVRGI